MAHSSLMTERLFSRCKVITLDLKERPLNKYFIKPVDPETEGLEGYYDIIKNPIDLTTVLSKLNDNQYESPVDWYNDVCLVYENALKYHKDNSIWHRIALYNLQEFKKVAIGIEYSDPQNWYDMVNTTMYKFSSLVANGPAPQGIDPLVISVLSKANETPLPDEQKIAQMVEKLNRKLFKDDIKFDVISILKETQPDLRLSHPKLTIDADNLTDLSLKALNLYLSYK